MDKRIVAPKNVHFLFFLVVGDIMYVCIYIHILYNVCDANICDAKKCQQAFLASLPGRA